MKFNEKLIELRKKAGLSQEELGYKLDVTRQTVSKWELGETTPEMAKLVEMSKIFNVSVDELTNDSEMNTNVNPIIEDRPIQDKKVGNNKVVIIIVAILAVVIIGIMGKVATTFMAINKINEGFANQGVEQDAKGFFGKIFNLINKAFDEQDGIINKISTSEFNSTFEFYTGTKSGSQLKHLLDKVNTKNKKEDRKIIVKYNEIETQDTTEIKNLKMQFEEFDDFEVSFEYDKDKYIYEVTIEKYEKNEGDTGINEVINNMNDMINQNKEDSEVFNQMDQFLNNTMNQFNY